MRLHVLAVLLLLVGLTGCATPYLATRYVCFSDFDANELIIHPNGRFVVVLAYLDENGARHNTGIHSGYYTEGPNTYDLKFDNLDHKQIEELFKGTLGGFVQNTDIYRIGKEYHISIVNGFRNQAGKTVVGGCMLEKLP